MKPNLILMSHGSLATALIESTKMILGDISDYDTISMKTDDTFTQIEDQLKLTLDKYKDKHVIIMTDIYGGTPFNIASKFYRKSNKISLISGMNLDMVIEYFSSDMNGNVKKFIEEIISVAKDSINLYSKNDKELYNDMTDL